MYQNVSFATHTDPFKFLDKSILKLYRFKFQFLYFSLFNSNKSICFHFLSIRVNYSLSCIHPRLSFSILWISLLIIFLCLLQSSTIPIRFNNFLSLLVYYFAYHIFNFYLTIQVQPLPNHFNPFLSILQSTTMTIFFVSYVSIQVYPLLDELCYFYLLKYTTTPILFDHYYSIEVDFLSNYLNSILFILKCFTAFLFLNSYPSIHVD